MLIDSRIKRFVEGTKIEESFCIRLTDVDEAYWFTDEVQAIDFLNAQARERVGDKELRKGYYDYQNEHGEIHRYLIKKVLRGKIEEFEEIVL